MPFIVLGCAVVMVGISLALEPHPKAPPSFDLVRQVILGAGAFMILSGVVWRIRNKKGKLIRAARRGDLATVRSLLANRPGLVHAKSGSDWTPLHRAAQRGHKAVVELLLDKRAPANARSIYGDTPLHMAAQAGHEEVAELLLYNNADVNAATNLGFTPLHNAVQFGRRNVVELLVRHGASVRAKNNFGSTPLEMAAAGHSELLELMRAEHAPARSRGAAQGAVAAYSASSLPAASRTNDTWEATIRDWHARVKACEDLNVTLVCPACKAVLTGFSCSRCGAPIEARGDRAAGVVNNVLACVLQVLSWAMGIFGSVMSKDVEIERIRKDSIRCNEVRLARCYQDSPETYDQAAFCYVAWLRRIGFFDCPDGFLCFIENYKGCESANPTLRRTLLDLAFVKGCETWSDWSKHSALITAACTGSEAQLRESQLIGTLEMEWQSKGRNTSGARELIALLSRLGLPT